MDIKKYIFGIILFLNVFTTQIAEAQKSNYDSYLALKNQPTDLSNLEKVESDTSHNFLDLYYMLISNCTLDRKERVRQLLLDLSEYGFQKDYVNELLIKHDCSINRFIDHDSLFNAKYQYKQDEFSNRVENDTISKLINHFYELDQISRRIYRISSDKRYVKFIDSINLTNIESWLNSNQIETKRIGVKLEEKLYIMMLHSFRYIPEARFKLLCEKLRHLVKQDKFHPIFYANIVDERLRVNKSSEYPKYNFLRSIEVPIENESQIQSNRRRINAY